MVEDLGLIVGGKDGGRLVHLYMWLSAGYS